MTERKIRGRVLNGYLDYVKKTWGQEGLNACLGDVGISDVKINDGDFYLNQTLLEIIKWISDNHGMDRVRLAGKHTVKNLGIFAYLVRFVSMDKMLNKARERYHEMYQFGKVEIEFVERGAVATMRDVVDIKENCMGWIGAFEAMLELTKSKGTVREVQCQVDGGDCCRFEIFWK